MGRTNTKLKKAHHQMEYTPEMISEIIKCKNDPIYFCRNYVYIKHPIRGQILFDLYSYQEEIIRNYQTNRLNILLSARQTGKTETTGAYILWFSIFNPSKNILIASNKSENAKDIISKIQNAYEELPDWLKPGINVNNWNKHTCEFENKTIIRAEATSETSGRSKSISLLFLDEFAHVVPHVQEEFWSAILPTLSTGGACIISSTPNGDSDKFAELWRTAELGDGVDDNTTSDPSTRLRFIPKWIQWDMAPGRDEQFKTDQIVLLGERKWLQEYECQFLGGEGTLLDNRIIIAREKEIISKGSNVLFKINDIPFFTQIKAGGTYIMGVDPSTGTGKDYTTIEIVEFPSLEQVMEYRSNTTRSPEIYALMKNILKFFTNNDCEVLFTVENNGVGEGIISLYSVDETFPEKATMVHEEGKNKFGFCTSDASKLKASNKFKMLVETNNLPMHSLILLKEIKNFARSGKTYNAKSGSTDDCISAYLLIIHILEDLATYDEQAYEKLYAMAINDNGAWTNDDIEVYREGEDDAMPFLI